MFSARLVVGALLATHVLATGQTYPVATAPPELRPLIQRGDLVIISMQSAVLRELRAELAAGGPEYAFKACHLESTALALRVAQREGVHVGRTSAWLRNPLNAAPQWALPIVSRRTSRTPSEGEGYIVDLGDRVGLLRPIVEQQICAPCHGPADHITPGVRATIATSYRDDHATGFREGDLRGWFWVELPKARVTNPVR